MQETWVQSLGQEDPLERGRATHSSILAWRIPGTEEPGGLQSMGLQWVEHHWSDWAHQQTPIFISIQSVSLKFPIPFQWLFIYFYYFEDIDIILNLFTNCPIIFIFFRVCSSKYWIYWFALLAFLSYVLELEFSGWSWNQISGVCYFSFLSLCSHPSLVRLLRSPLCSHPDSPVHN